MWGGGYLHRNNHLGSRGVSVIWGVRKAWRGMYEGVWARPVRKSFEYDRRWIRTPSLTSSQHHRFSRCGTQGRDGLPTYADRPQPFINKRCFFFFLDLVLARDVNQPRWEGGR